MRRQGERRLRGDGTRRIFDLVPWIIAWCCYCASMRYWDHWAAAHHLVPFPEGWMALIGALVAAVVIHEGGHALCGTSVGMKLYAIVVGPLRWNIRDGWAGIRIDMARLLSFRVAVALVPTNPKQGKRAYIWMILAGPLANFTGACVFCVLVFALAGTPYQYGWRFFAASATIGAIMCAINLVPTRVEQGYSDGARLYQLLKGGSWSELHRMRVMVSASLATPLRPRDYDIELIRRTARSFPLGHEGVLVRLVESAYFLDRGEFKRAGESLRAAEMICEQGEMRIPPELCAVLAFRIALVQCDGGGARRWWEKIPDGDKGFRDGEYWLADGALALREGRLQDSQEAWRKATMLVSQLPESGSCEFKRYCCDLLRNAISSAEAVG